MWGDRVGLTCYRVGLCCRVELWCHKLVELWCHKLVELANTLALWLHRLAE